MEQRTGHTTERSPEALARENERLQRALRARLSEEAALRRVATLVAQQHAPEEVFTLVTQEVARHLDADAAITVRYDGPGLATVVATRRPHLGTSLEVGRRMVLAPETSLARVQATLAPARIDSFESVPGDYAVEMRTIGLRAGVAAPILVDARLWGAVAAGSRSGPFPEGSEARIGAFAELVAQAIANVDARIKLKESRARIVEAADDARRRIERDLHDGAQQRLVGVALSLRLVAGHAEPATAAAIEGCIEELLTALAELRELARGLHPAVLSERGLRPALEMLAARSPVPVALDGRLDARVPPAHEAALYFVAAETLTNVAKYANATAVEVTLQRHDAWAEIAVADDGVGGARTDAGSSANRLLRREAQGEARWQRAHCGERRGPSRTQVVRFTVQPGAKFPWHTHRGPVIVNVTQGELVYVDREDCAEHSYTAGTAFVDPGHGHAHTAYNPTDAPTTPLYCFCPRTPPRTATSESRYGIERAARIDPGRAETLTARPGGPEGLNSSGAIGRSADHLDSLDRPRRRSPSGCERSLPLRSAPLEDCCRAALRDRRAALLTHCGSVYTSL